MSSTLPPPEQSTPTKPSVLATAHTGGNTAILFLLCALSVVLNLLLWFRLSSIQEHLAEQSAQSQEWAQEARTLARESGQRSDEVAAKQALTDLRVSELAHQRNQVEALLQSAARNQVEYLLSDLESSLRLAEQQSQSTGKPQTLLIALQQAKERLSRAGLPAQLAPLTRALTQDIEQVQTARFLDTENLLDTIEIIIIKSAQARLLAQSPLSRAAGLVTTPTTDARSSRGSQPPAAIEQKNQLPVDAETVWARLQLPALSLWRQHLVPAFRQLVRIDTLANRDASLLSSAEGEVLRQRLHSHLLQARLGLLTQRLPLVRQDIAQAEILVRDYFDPADSHYEAMRKALGQLRTQTETEVTTPQATHSLQVIAMMVANTTAQTGTRQKATP